ncbi:MAG: preprotein translocase subunit YajC [Atopobiaceae bacterium]|jgi:preprotein translocase subunit YajC|nr:preprotein translocase subunit YajC [Atopobiaceae bacterium]MCH4180194.1 preprotein translocase subunit YajC [Atopobiaceae bacterium]MCH4214364.1 preprotein translocase subunit YajC [Atopobiaceae bacterium]MCH4229205.1 preprotein translocase subunit YajC [Atopobiaceae bacterium]MCH4276576.1 preprotein translocase subunit YajC [Atopobiaceae bacterium]
MDIAQSILGASIALLIFLGVGGLIYTIWSRGKVKRQKGYYEDIHKNLSNGQRVMFSDGLFGVVQRVGKETCDVKVKGGTVIEVSRFAIQEIVKK